METQQNVFLYWIGHEYKLISLLRNLIYLHSTNGKGYNVHLITEKNIKEYIKDLPEYFYSLQPAHQADFVRVCVLCDYGGIWMDSDTLVIDSMDSLFDLNKHKNGFFIRENNNILWNGVFGTNKQTPLMIEWKKRMLEILDIKKEKINWSEIGCMMLQSMYDSNPMLFENYTIFNGLDNLYPVNWNKCVLEFIQKPYDNYKNIIREYQPFVVLVNSVYKQLESKSVEQILNGNLPLNYFINKSFENMKHLRNYDFIEIGTSNFDTIIQEVDDDVLGISVDAVNYYLDKLPNKLNCKKINVGISNVESTLKVYYIPEKTIDDKKLPQWLKGCNCINTYHPLHIKHNLQHLCTFDMVNVIPLSKLCYRNQVKNIKYLKIVTEGHDCIILKSFHSYLQYLPKQFYPNTLLFQSNEHTKTSDVDEIIRLYIQLGYKLIKRGYDTMMVFDI
jgi:hypothetical protein